MSHKNQEKTIEGRKLAHYCPYCHENLTVGSVEHNKYHEKGLNAQYNFEYVAKSELDLERIQKRDSR